MSKKLLLLKLLLSRWSNVPATAAHFRMVLVTTQLKSLDPQLQVNKKGEF